MPVECGVVTKLFFAFKQQQSELKPGYPYLTAKTLFDSPVEGVLGFVGESLMSEKKSRSKFFKEFFNLKRTTSGDAIHHILHRNPLHFEIIWLQLYFVMENAVAKRKFASVSRFFGRCYQGPAAYEMLDTKVS